jgi:hypothetical protein
MLTTLAKPSLDIPPPRVRRALRLVGKMTRCSSTGPLTEILLEAAAALRNIDLRDLGGRQSRTRRPHWPERTKRAESTDKWTKPERSGAIFEADQGFALIRHPRCGLIAATEIS